MMQAMQGNHYIAYGLFAAGFFILWLGLSWHFDWLLLGLGLLSALIAARVARQLDGMNGFTAPLLPKPLRFIPYALWLAREIWKSNLAVAWLILFPSRIRPGLTRLPPAPTPPLTALLANSITLTPGTVTLKADDDGLLIHALVLDEAGKKALAEMSQRVAALGDKQGAA